MFELYIYIFVLQSLPVQIGHVYKIRSNNSVSAWIQGGHETDGILLLSLTETAFENFQILGMKQNHLFVCPIMLSYYVILYIKPSKIAS